MKNSVAYLVAGLLLLGSFFIAPSAEARFLQVDPIGYEADMNMYAYVTNDPLNLNDPSGLAPNQQGATDFRAVSAIISAVGMKGLSGNGSNSHRYFHTKDYGWVDVRHFGTGAEKVRDGMPGVVLEAGGVWVETKQWATEWGGDYRSGFSPEDLPSNSAGADFGGLLEDNPNADPAKLFEQWAASVGATAGTDAAYQEAFKALPVEDPSVRGGQGRGSSNASSTPNGAARSNDTGSSGANSSDGRDRCGYESGQRTC